jgi:hypothetical protein
MNKTVIQIAVRLMSTARVCPLVSCVTALLCSATVASGAPRYGLEGLLSRAEHVLIVDLVARTSSNATFEVREVLRGDTSLKTLVLSHTQAEYAFPKDTNALLLFSQGDAHFGPPKPEFCIGEPVAGQASYRGWILGESEVKSPYGRKRLLELMEHSPYRADIYSRSGTGAN